MAAIDYTSRDYDSLRQDMLNQARIKIPEWTDQSSNDFGVVLIELFAYVGDVLSYYADRIANEAYLATATQRANVLNIARMLDYQPGGNVASQVTVQFSNTSGSTQTIPAGTQVATVTGNLVFETQVACTVANNGTATVLAAQGTSVTNEALGQSNGGLNQDFLLFQTPVIDGSPKVYVNTGSGPVQWTYIEHLIDGTSSDSIFTSYTDAAGVVHIVFGDGINGLVPPQNAAITASYRVGGGVAGNVGAGTIITFVSSVPANVAITNPAAATGGADAETLDSIRTNAPRSLFTLNRAVNLADYAQLALRVPGVAKANATSSVYSSVTLYVAPAGGGGLDGSNTPTAAFATTMANVAAYFVGKTAASATVTVTKPSYIPITITLSIQVLSNYNQNSVYTAVVTALNNYLAFDNVKFGQRCAIGDIYSTILSVPGVQYGTVTVLSRTGSGLADVQLSSNEIPVSVSSGATTITVTASGGIVTT